MMTFARLFCLFLTMSITLSGMSQKITEVHFASDSWEGATNKDKTGLFFDIARYVYGQAGIKVKITIAPYSRTIAMTKKGDADAFVGSFIDEEKFALYPKWHIDVNRISILFLKNKIKWTGPDTVNGKRVAMRREFDYDSYISQKFKKIEVDKKDQAIGMLEKGRVDFYIEADMEIATWLKEKAKKDKNYAQVEFEKKFVQESFLNLKLYYAFANNERGRHLRKIWDEGMAKLYKSAKVKEIYSNRNFTDYEKALGKDVTKGY